MEDKFSNQDKYSKEEQIQSLFAMMYNQLLLYRNMLGKGQKEEMKDVDQSFLDEIKRITRDI